MIPFELFTRSTRSLLTFLWLLLGMNGRKSSVGKSQKSIHSFFGQGKPAGNPKSAGTQPDPAVSALAQQHKNEKGVKRVREADKDDEANADDAVVCIDASPVSKAKSPAETGNKQLQPTATANGQLQPAVATNRNAKAAKTTDVAQPRDAPDSDLTQSATPQAQQAVSHAASKQDAPEQAAQVVQGALQHPNVPTRDPKRQQLATRKFAIKRQRFQLGEDQESCKKAAGKYTPLEKQVIELRKKNPGFVLLVEVRSALSLTAAPMGMVHVGTVLFGTRGCATNLLYRYMYACTPCYCYTSSEHGLGTHACAV